MRNLNKEFEKELIDYNKLIKYGFTKLNNGYIYKSKILDNQFEMNIYISDEEKNARLFDLENDEEYILVDIESSEGTFVGNVRLEYEKKINDVIEKCTEKEVFKNNQTKEIIKYVKQKYGDELEFLWEKFDDTAILRNKQNNKWYAAFMIISENKLGIKSDKKIEVIDLRYQKENTEEIIDYKKIYPGYHMNKKSWITIKLDNSMDIENICEFIDNSYKLSIGNKYSMAGDELSQKVYNYLKTIPKGKVVTYKQIAEYLGNKGLARVVGTILHKNPDGDKYPCYKVLNSKGELAEAFVFGGKEVQRERLEKDGITVIDNKVDLNLFQWKE